MKKYTLLLLIFITVGTFVFAEKITVGTEGTYAPYTYHQKNGKLVGYDVDVIKAIAKDLKLEIEFVESRWDALLAGVKTGRWDIVANQVWWNKERNKDFTLSAPYMQAGAAILVPANSKARTAQDLKGLRAAVSLTSAYRPLVEKLTDRTITQDDFVIAASLIASKRVDFVVNDFDTIADYLYKNPKSKLRAIPWTEAGSHDVVFALKKGNTDLKEKIDASIKKLKANGTLDRIFKKYISK